MVESKVYRTPLTTELKIIFGLQAQFIKKSAGLAGLQSQSQRLQSAAINFDTKNKELIPLLDKEIECMFSTTVQKWII